MRIVLAAVMFASAAAACATADAATPTPDGKNTPAGAGDEDGDGNGSGDVPGASTSCAPSPRCDGASTPASGSAGSWKHLGSRLVVASGAPNHRGRDQIVVEGAAQWIIGKIAYGVADKDLEDENVDVFVDRGCAGGWEKIGSTRTTEEGASTHPTVEGVEDTGGRVYFEIPKDKALPLGRHRARLVVAGDLSTAELVLDVVPVGARIFVSDVDGTLTSSENAEFPALLTGALPAVQPDAPEVLRALAERGYRPVYLTARPEWLTGRTREFLATHGFPPGVIHTTTTVTGAVGDAAAAYKSAELAMLGAKKLSIAWAFGNKPSDTDAYEAARVEPKEQRIFLQADDTHGGRRIEAYADVLSVAKGSPRACTGL